VPRNLSAKLANERGHELALFGRPGRDGELDGRYDATETFFDASPDLVPRADRYVGMQKFIASSGAVAISG
jgi:hypothetical protein